MDIFWIILIFPVVWPFIARIVFHSTITWTEMALNVVLVLVLVSAVWVAGRYAETADREVWNGEVTGKDSYRVSCSHSYPCNCRTVTVGTGKSRTTTTQCDTCYEHSYDIDWVVHSNVGKIYINRVDRQGLHEPPRWTRAYKGEPVATTHMYTNYIKASDNSLFNASQQNLVKKFEKLIPEYPLEVYDYHYIDRVLAVDVDVPDLDKWNFELAQYLRELGPKKQANVVIVIVNTDNPLYMDALRSAWKGAKKNDIVVTIGVTDYPNISWANAWSWSKNEMVNVTLRDEITNIGTLDRSVVLKTINDTVMKYFERRPMAEFEYLKDEIEPPLWVQILAGIIAVLGSVGLTVWFHHVDIRLNLGK